MNINFYILRFDSLFFKNNLTLQKIFKNQNMNPIMLRFKLLLFLFYRCFLLDAETLPFYPKYLEKLNYQNSHLLLQKKKLEKLQIMINQKKSLFASPFFFNFSYKKGNNTQPFNIYNNQPSVNQNLNEYIIGISKVLDILQTQSTEKEIYEIQITIEKHYLDLLEKQIKNQFLESYFVAIFLEHIMEHLEEHIVKFEYLKRKFHREYFDKKLGLYTAAALDIGISTLRSEYQETKKLYLKELELLNILLNQENQILQLDEFSFILKYLPNKIETSKEALVNSYHLCPIYIIEITKLQLEEKKMILVKNQKWNQIEIFLNHGILNLGKYANPSFNPISPEKENYWSLGVKLPLPYGSELNYNDFLQKKEIEIQSLNIKKSEVELKNQISNFYEIYEKDNQQLRNNLYILEKHEPFLKSLEESLLNRRITYFEYWGEHERFHNLLRMSLNLLYNSLTSLHALELFTGKNLIKDPI